MGVRNAVLKITKELQNSDEEILVFGPLIHNPQTIELLEMRGMRVINSLEKIRGKQVAIRSHGIPINEYRDIKSKAIRVINLTCPRVARVQAIIKKFSSRGYFVIIIGDRDHAEVIGLMSYASQGCAVVSDVADLSGIPGNHKYVIVAQTTADRQLFADVIESIKMQFNDIEIVDTICDSTRHRQEELLKGIEDGIDTLVVVGGKNSANTKRLARIGEKSGIRTVLIESENEIEEKDFSNSKSVLITAGASTPGWIINGVTEKLHEISCKQSNFVFYGLFRFYELLVKTNILSSIGAAAITIMTLLVTNWPINADLPAISFLYIFSMYSINNYMEQQSLRINNPNKYRIYKKYGKFFLFFSILSIAFTILLAYRQSVLVMTILAISTVLGAMYSSDLVKSITARFRSKHLSRFYNSRVVSSLGWVVITVISPMMDTGPDPLQMTALCLFVFTLIFMKQILIDMVAFQGDLILGRETLAIVLGPRGVKYLFVLMALVTVPLMIYASVINNKLFLLFITSIAYYIGLMIIISRPLSVNSMRYELAVDANFIIILGLLPVLL